MLFSRPSSQNEITLSRWQHKLGTPEPGRNHTRQPTSHVRITCAKLFCWNHALYCRRYLGTEHNTFGEERPSTSTTPPIKSRLLDLFRRSFNSSFTVFYSIFLSCPKHLHYFIMFILVEYHSKEIRMYTQTLS